MYNGSEYEDSHIFRLEMQYNLNGSDVYQLIGEKEAKKDKWTTISGYYTVPEGAENFSIYVQTDNLKDGDLPTRLWVPTFQSCFQNRKNILSSLQRLPR
mgnify:CR=1 FL=1